jgi:hypothetical protein
VTERTDKFTERARRVLNLARAEARDLNHNYIGTEHLLLGLVREGEGVGAQVLANLGVELKKVRSAVEFIIGPGDRPVTGEIGLTPRAKKVIGLAVDEANRLGHDYIGTEHLLVGMLREGEGIAAGVLESLGLGLEEVRAEVVRILAAGTAAGGRPGLRPRGQARAEAFWNTSRAYAELSVLRDLLGHRDLYGELIQLQRSTSRHMSVTPIFGGRGFALDSELCFVLMPFAEELRPIYDDHISKVVGQCGLKCIRADNVFGPGQIMEQIWEQMNSATLIIADVSGKNPNVFYELGIAHTLGKPVILITRSEDDVPFDLRHLRFIQYEYTPRGCQELERKLREAIQTIVGSRRQ